MNHGINKYFNFFDFIVGRLTVNFLSISTSSSTVLNYSVVQFIYLYLYIFLATSSQDDLHRRIGGRCSSDNMKVVFKVCCRPEDVQNNSE